MQKFVGERKHASSGQEIDVKNRNYRKDKT